MRKKNKEVDEHTHTQTHKKKQNGIRLVSGNRALIL